MSGVLLDADDLPELGCKKRHCPSAKWMPFPPSRLCSLQVLPYTEVCGSQDLLSELQPQQVSLSGFAPARSLWGWLCTGFSHVAEASQVLRQALTATRSLSSCTEVIEDGGENTNACC